MKFIGRILLGVIALPFAIAAGATALLVAAFFDPLIAGLAGTALQVGFESLVEILFENDDPASVFEGSVAGAGRIAFAILVAPVLFTAIVAEAIGARSLLCHAGGTALLTAAMPWLSRDVSRAATPEETQITLMLALVGAAAGFVYWLIAGRVAGPAREPLPSTALVRSGS